MTQEETFAWIFLSTALATGTEPANMSGISMVADGINHAVPTQKEFQISFSWLTKKGLIKKVGKKYSLTTEGKTEFDKASDNSKDKLQKSKYIMKSTQYNIFFVTGYSFILASALFLIFKMLPHNPISSLIFGVVFFSALAISLLYYKLTISINEEEIAISFGIGFIRKNYKLNTIKKCATAKEKFSIESRVRFERRPGGGKSYVLSSALPSIEITYINENGMIQRDIIGTNKPDLIAEFINSKISIAKI